MAENKPAIGSVVKYGEITTVVVGYEQGGRTVQLPIGSGGSTHEAFWEEDDLEIIEGDPSPYRIFRVGQESANIEKEVAETVASLAMEGHIPKSSLPILFTVTGEDVAMKVAELME